MRKEIKQISLEEIERFLEDYDRELVFEKTNFVPKEQELRYKLEEYVDYDQINRNAVLGIDIYQYSSYGSFEQTLIPFLFDKMFEMAARLCKENHPFIFQGYSVEDIRKHFISAGDGGFLILETPMHALLFAVNLATILRIYNSYNLYPKLRKVIGGITLRYAITYDKLYRFEDNFYGRAIINNARILVKDDLNRCLIDEHVHTWFTTNIGGLESLQVLTMEDVTNIFHFRENYNVDYLRKEDPIFGDQTSRDIGIINSDVLKIGKIKSKETDLTIYNLHLQVSLWVEHEQAGQKKRVTLSMGNLNTTGI